MVTGIYIPQTLPAEVNHTGYCNTSSQSSHVTDTTTTTKSYPVKIFRKNESGNIGKNDF